MQIDGRTHMKAVVLTGFGSFDQLEYRVNHPIPSPNDNEVLIKVGACGVNNTDLWTREGAYGDPFDAQAPSGWQNGDFHFPRVQGADIVGQIVEVGSSVSRSRIGERVMVNPTLYNGDGEQSLPLAEIIGSERDGGFAEFAAVFAENAIPINSDLTDAELATFMISYLTAEHMLNRGGVTKDAKLLVTGTSGGVGSALIQLAKRRNAQIIAVISAHKEAQARAIGADFIIHRGNNIRDALARIHVHDVDVITDIVGGPQMTELIDVLRPGGTLVTAGAIAGPITQIDWRKIYLKHLDILGATMGTMQEAKDIVRYIESREIKPLLYKTYPLIDIVQAQKDFIEKNFFGKLAIVP